MFSYLSRQLVIRLWPLNSGSTSSLEFLNAHRWNLLLHALVAAPVPQIHHSAWNIACKAWVQVIPFSHHSLSAPNSLPSSGILTIQQRLSAFCVVTSQYISSFLLISAQIHSHNGGRILLTQPATTVFQLQFSPSQQDFLFKILFKFLYFFSIAPVPSLLVSNHISEQIFFYPE